MKNLKLHIGCSSFYNANWKPEFYPEDLAKSKWFDFYSQHFSTYEMNGTFYKAPTLKVMQNWYKKCQEGFIYAVKAPKIITHLKKFKECDEEIKTFYQVCEEGLREKLGPLLFQLPPSFHYSEENIELVIKNLKTEFTNVVEFRHESWWKKEVFEILKQNKITFCNVSHPTLPDSIIQTSKIGYLRFHGSPKMFYSSYSDEYLNKIYEEIKANSFEEFYIFFNNTASVAGILNALEMKNIATKNKIYE